jgi:NAD+ synthase (glutamine-hydrolysing)
VPNASPYERGKEYVRRELCARRAREAGAALAYVNMFAADELVFDGGSLVVDASGALVGCAPSSPHRARLPGRVHGDTER